MENNEYLELFVLSVLLGFIIGRLWERWIYYNKTGKHLSDLKKNNN